MPKVSVSLGLTIQLNEGAREYARPQVDIAEIDTSQDVQKQIDEAKRAVIQVWDAESELLYNKMVELTDKDLANLKNPLQEIRKQLAEALQEVDERIINHSHAVNLPLFAK